MKHPSYGRDLWLLRIDQALGCRFGDCPAVTACVPTRLLPLPGPAAEVHLITFKTADLAFRVNPAPRTLPFSIRFLSFTIRIANRPWQTPGVHPLSRPRPLLRPRWRLRQPATSFPRRIGPRSRYARRPLPSGAVRPKLTQVSFALASRRATGRRSRLVVRRRRCRQHCIAVFERSRISHDSWTNVS